MPAFPLGRSRVRVTAASRLHWGLFSFGESGEPAAGGSRAFGGLGLMIDHPGLCLELIAENVPNANGLECLVETCPNPLDAKNPLVAKNPLENLAATSSSSAHGASTHDTAARALQIAQQLIDSADRPAALFSWQGRLRIRLLRTPPEHVGLGTGTQLTLAIAAGLAKLCGLNTPSEEALAAWTGRGKRSAVGLYGFFQGGLIYDAGKQQGELLGRLQARLDFPPPWQWLLIRPRHLTGKSGEAERQAFSGLPPMAAEVTLAMQQLIEEQLLPAAQAQNFPQFAAGLFEYGQQAGRGFETCQGGLYAAPEICALVERLRALGVQGVAQSSWGPTLSCLFSSQESLATFLHANGHWLAAEEFVCQSAVGWNQGTQVERLTIES